MATFTLSLENSVEAVNGIATPDQANVRVTRDGDITNQQAKTPEVTTDLQTKPTEPVPGLNN